MKNYLLLVLLASILLLPVSCGCPADSRTPIVWQKTFGGNGGDFGDSVQQTSDGGYIIAGFTDSWGAGNGDVYLIKTDVEGNELWFKTFGGSGIDDARAVRQTDDGGYIIVGTTGGRRGDSGNDVYLIKTDAKGNELWSKSYGGSNRDDGYSVWLTADGGYIIAGITETPPFGTSKFDIYLIKTDSEGNELWSKSFGSKYTDFAAAVQQTADGGYIVLGTTDIDIDEDREVDSDIYLIKMDEAGNELWSKTYGGSNSAEDREDGNALEVTADGGYIIVGLTVAYRSQSPADTDYYDVYVIKTDAEGNTSPWGE